MGAAGLSWGGVAQPCLLSWPIPGAGPAALLRSPHSGGGLVPAATNWLTASTSDSPSLAPVPWDVKREGDTRRPIHTLRRSRGVIGESPFTQLNGIFHFSAELLSIVQSELSAHAGGEFEVSV